MRKKVLITGANRGIGKALVEKFAQCNFDVIACARIEREDFNEYLKYIENKYNVNVIASYFDLENEQAIKQELRMVLNNQKKIDVLINNAGYSASSLFAMTSIEELKKEMQINYISPIIISQIVARYMKKNKEGCIINVASVSGIRNEEGRLAYGSSKAALLFATKTMALELASDNIRVNSVSPGFIDTDMWKNRSDKLYDKVLRETPVGRQGSTYDVVDMIYYLASDKASYITGQNIVIDGGRMI